jgi:hypothetical protein
VEVDVELLGQFVEAGLGVPNAEEPLLLGQLALAAGAAGVFAVAAVPLVPKLVPAGAMAPVCAVLAHVGVDAGFIVVGLPAPLTEEVDVIVLPGPLMAAGLGVLHGDCD